MKVTRALRHLLPLCLAIPVLLLSGTQFAHADLYALPTNIKPLLPLEEAIDVARTFMKKDELRGYHITHVYANGTGKGDGGGAWHIQFRKGAEEKWLILTLWFPKDTCMIAITRQDPMGPGDGTLIEDGPPISEAEEAFCKIFYTREGKPIPPGTHIPEEERPAPSPDPFGPANR